MGYFKQPIRRSTARDEKLAWLEPTRTIKLDDWQRCGKTFKPKPKTFLRFVVEMPEGGQIGLFRGGELIDDPEILSDSLLSEMNDTFRWFNKNLKVPRRLPKTAACWFRADAQESISKLRTLIEIYREAGHHVWMHASLAPGRIVYQDDLQIAAVPFRDLRKTSTPV